MILSWQQSELAGVRSPLAPVASFGEDPLLDFGPWVRQVGQGGSQVDYPTQALDRSGGTRSHGLRAHHEHYPGYDARVSED